VVRRYLALFFPRWPVQHVRRLHPELHGRPLALFERSQRGAHLRVCSGEANTLGVRSGMSVADAKALAQQIELQELRLPECDAALAELCLWATRFSPLAGVEPVGPHAPYAQTLLLDIAGCEGVFGGEEKLLALALDGLRRQGFKVRAAIAPTLGAAWALSHYGPTTALAPSDPEPLKALLAPLPLAGLRLPPEVLDDFRPLGLNRIGDILRQPRAALPSRFGKELIERLDQAFNTVPEALAPQRTPPEFRVARAFEYPVCDSGVLHKILEQLVERLAGDLKKAQRGARQIECWLYHDLTQPVCAEIALHRSSHSRRHLWQLLRARLEDVLRAPAGRGTKLRRKKTISAARKGLAIEVDERIEAVALNVTASEPVADLQLPLFARNKDAAGSSAEAGGELNLLLDRLVTRLGASAVCRVQLEDDRLPERSYRLLTLEQHAGMKTEPRPAREFPPRPLRVLPQPISLWVDWPRAVAFDGAQHAIRNVSGPERIESGWWRACDQCRDYYVVAVDGGARYWVFQDLLDQRWFLHGTFD
jgi:protein ImuB